MKRIAVIGIAAILVAGGWHLGRGRTEEIRPSYQYRSLEADDKSGRSVVIEDERVYYHKEKGVVETEIGGERQIVAVAGRFAGFEEVAGSSDKILRLTAIEGSEELPTVRVVLGSDEGGLKPTNWRVVNLAQADRIDFDRTIKLMGRLADLTPKQVEKIILPGDVIRAEIDSGVRDEQERRVAKFIDLRRWGGVKAVEAELK